MQRERAGAQREREEPPVAQPHPGRAAAPLCPAGGGARSRYCEPSGTGGRSADMREIV